jgi:hypothetical protein
MGIREVFSESGNHYEEQPEIEFRKQKPDVERQVYIAWVVEPAGEGEAAVLRPAEGLGPRQDPDSGGVLLPTQPTH